MLLHFPFPSFPFLQNHSEEIDSPGLRYPRQLLPCLLKRGRWADQQQSQEQYYRYVRIAVREVPEVLWQPQESQHVLRLLQDPPKIVTDRQRGEHPQTARAAAAQAGGPLALLPLQEEGGTAGLQLQGLRLLLLQHPPPPRGPQVRRQLHRASQGRDQTQQPQHHCRQDIKNMMKQHHSRILTSLLVHSRNESCPSRFDYEQILFLRRRVSRLSRSSLPRLPLRNSLQLILLSCPSVSILADCELWLFALTRSPSPRCSFIMRSSIAIGASSPTSSLSGFMLTLIISQRSRRIWFSRIRVKVSFSCFSMCSLKPSIFQRRTELAAMRSRIIAIDSRISLVDLSVLPPPVLLLSKCQQDLSLRGLESMPIQLRDLSFMQSFVVILLSFSNPLGSSQLSSSFLMLRLVSVRLKRFFPLQEGHQLFSSNFVINCMCSSNFLSCYLNCAFCSLNWWFSCILGSTFLTGALLMYEAMLAQVSVCTDSSKCAMVGLRQAIMTQQELPPIDCFSKDVSLLSLQGGIMLALPVVDVQYSEAITCRKVNKLLLIYMPYLKTMPVDFVTFCLSLPAKSTISNLLSTCSEGSSSRQLCTLSVSRQCDLLEELFILCDPMILFFCPFFHHFMASSDDRHCPSNMFSTVNCCSLFQRIFNGRPSLVSIRSKIDSLYIWMKEMNTLNPLSEEDFSSIFANRPRMALGMIPQVSCESPPSMVQVLPDPVCPQAKMVE